MRRCVGRGRHPAAEQRRTTTTPPDQRWRVSRSRNRKSGSRAPLETLVCGFFRAHSKKSKRVGRVSHRSGLEQVNVTSRWLALDTDRANE